METQASVVPNTAGLVSFSTGAAGSCKFSTCARVTQQNDLNIKPDKGHFQFQWGITMGDTVTNGDINGDIQLIPSYPMIIWDIWRARHVQFPLQIELCSGTWSPRQGMHPPQNYSAEIHSAWMWRMAPGISWDFGEIYGWSSQNISHTLW